jgi:HAD superfamily hydrolase (TIGR01509 family)
MNRRYFRNDLADQALATAQAVIFDLNGLIVDDESIQLQATNDSLLPFGIVLDEAQWIRRCVGRKPSEYLSALLRETGQSPAFSDSIIHSRDRRYQEYMEQEALRLVRAGALELLGWLGDQFKLRALASSTTSAGVAVVLAALNLKLGSDFDVILSGDDVRRGKPDPEIYLKARTLLNNPQCCVALEDSESGIRSAKAAKLCCIAVPNRFTRHQDLSEADIALSDLTPEAVLR